MLPSRTTEWPLATHPSPHPAVLERSYRPVAVRYWRVEGPDCATRVGTRQTLSKTR